MFHPAWPIRRTTDWRTSRWMALALVLLGHLMLLAWWRERPMPTTQEAPLVLQGRLLRDPVVAAPQYEPRHARTPQRQRAPSAVTAPSAPAPPAQAARAAAPAERAAADFVEARQLDLRLGPPPDPAPSLAESNVARSAARGAGHAFGPHAASAPRAGGPVQESRGAAGRWQARVEVGGSAYCLQGQDPSLRRDPFEKALAVPSTCR